MGEFGKVMAKITLGLSKGFPLHMQVALANFESQANKKLYDEQAKRAAAEYAAETAS